MVCGVLLKILNFLEKQLCSGKIFHVTEDIRLRADQLIGFGKIGLATAADDFFCYRSRKWVTGNTRKRIRPSALERQTNIFYRFLCPNLFTDNGDPLVDCLSCIDEPPIAGFLNSKKLMQRMFQWVIVI